MCNVDIEVLTGLKCPYCNRKTQHVDSRIIYGTGHTRFFSPCMMYICKKCRAYVGCHKKDQNRALGRVANKTLRELKIQAHDKFDPLWKKLLQRFEKWQARTIAYKWLAQEMNVDPKYCHIGMFDEEQCIIAIKLCSEVGSLIRWHEFHQKIIVKTPRNESSKKCKRRA